MNLRPFRGAARPQSTPHARPTRATAWPDGRNGPVADPSRERTWAFATLAMLALVAATLGTLAV